MKTKNFILIGAMGAGKSTVGRRLAKRLRIQFYDSDKIMEERTGVNIPTVFEYEGESGFRAREEKIISDLCQLEDIVLATGGGAILLDSGTADQSSSSSVLEGDFYLIRDIASTAYDRPLEGDLIYHPVFAMLFEIKSVEDEEPFYQLDNLPVYKMSCQIFDYSSEILDTGVAVIDNIEDNLSTDTLAYQITLEQSSAVNEEIRLEIATDDDVSSGLLLEETDGDNILGESDSTSVGESIILERAADSGDAEYLIQEDYIVGDFDQDKTSQNELFEAQSRSVLDFSELNPFGDAGSSS